MTNQMYGLRLHEDGVASWSLHGEKYGGDFKRKASIEHFNNGVRSGLMPPVIHYISPQRNVFAFDRPPCKVTLNYHGGRIIDIEQDLITTTQQHEVWLPWTAYVVLGHGGYISQVYLFALDGPLTSIDQRISLLPLTNYNTTGNFCVPEGTYQFTTIAEAMTMTWDLVWNSNFNLDIREVVDFCYASGQPKEIFERLDQRSLKRRSAADLYVAWSQMSREEVEKTQFIQHEKMDQLAYLFNMGTITPTNFVTQNAAALRY